MTTAREEESRDPWPELYKRRLIAAILGAADLFPHPGEDESERVHDARKALKEARALAKLMTGVVGPPAYEALRELEAARRRMGRARDLDVMPDALASLGGRVESRLIDALGQAIASERDSARAAHREIDAGAQIARLRALARGVEAWDLAEIDLFDVARSLRVLYRLARRRGKQALASGEPHELHELRAAIVDLGHCFAALEPAWPAHFAAFAQEFRRMRDQLGKHNDLTILAEFAAAREEVSEAQSHALSRAVERRQKRLAKKAQRLFDRLFAERPNALFDRLTAYLENPRAPVKASHSIVDSGTSIPRRGRRRDR
jgi:CHAD domain-containing protein